MYKTLLRLLFWGCFCQPVLGQVVIKFPASPLDSCDFEKQAEFRLWQNDSMFIEYDTKAINYFAALNRSFLPSYYDLRRLVKADLTTTELADLQQLDSLYKISWAQKRAYCLGEGAVNHNLSAFVHLSWVLIFEVYQIYPDVASIVVAGPHVVAKGQTEFDFSKIARKLSKDLAKSPLRTKYQAEFQHFQTNREALRMRERFNPVTFGRQNLTDERFNDYQWLSFLVWVSRG